jgi:hypothetical protein
VFWNGIKDCQCIFQSIFVDFFTVELALPLSVLMFLVFEVPNKITFGLVSFG